MTLLPRRPVLLLPLPKSHLQAFTSRLLYNNLHGEQRGSRDVGSCSRSSAQMSRKLLRRRLLRLSPSCSSHLAHRTSSHRHLELATSEAVVVEALQQIRDQEMAAACNIATNSKANGLLPSRNSLQHVLFECQPSSCFFTVSCGRIDFVRLRIRRVIGPLNILNGSVRWSDRRVGRKSEAMPSRYSTARFGGVTVVLAGDPKQCLPVILNGSVRWGDHPVGRGSEAMPSRYSTARFGGVTVVLAVPSRYSQLIACTNCLELATPEGVVVEALPRIRDKFYQEMSAACSIDPVADPQHLGSVEWTTARILLVARRLGGLKVSNDIVNRKSLSSSVPVARGARRRT
ncbi:BQ5605_C006g04178 [Microbotryum silenes-dioicae]|uniref:BQ5605_C006g04178 protein n=1 Tax=Microbotryum silenes-dioicae TaxID=796604 RepID=A0A2X0MTC3_9BASI|nr:BQ5605_C006g04178 [Microbotryum silenes-dioicae]